MKYSELIESIGSTLPRPCQRAATPLTHFAESKAELNDLGNRFCYRLADESVVMITPATQRKLARINESKPEILEWIGRDLATFKKAVRELKQ